MAGIGEASAILGVAQLGLQLAQTLVTVIGDYRDAARNINRLRDEVHLTSICLQQLGDLAKHNRLIAGQGVLEATNLCERCRGVIWQIRTIIKKGSEPLDPEQITKSQIDVKTFQSLKWAVWTKKQLEEPRLELDRLKESMTLTFVSHMAFLATTEFERAKYVSQIPGIKRNIKWTQQAEADLEQDYEEFERWRARQVEVKDDDNIRKKLEAAGLSDQRITDMLNSAVIPEPQLSDKYPPKVMFRAWSLDPLAQSTRVNLSDAWLARYLDQHGVGPENLWQRHSGLHPWYKNMVKTLLDEQRQNRYVWSLVSLEPVYRHAWLKHGIPKTLNVVLRGEPMQTRSAAPGEFANHDAATMPETRVSTTPYLDKIEILTPSTSEPHETDEEIIEKQLALYNQNRDAT